MPVSGIFIPALAPATIVPSSLQKWNAPSAKPPSHTKALLEATSKAICSQFVENFRKSPNFTENFTPSRNLAHPGGGSLTAASESLVSPDVEPLHREIRMYSAQDERWAIRPW